MLVSDNRSVLAEVKPRLAALVEDLLAKGSDRLSIIYVLEKEIAALRDSPKPAGQSTVV